MVSTALVPRLLREARHGRGLMLVVAIGINLCSGCDDGIQVRNEPADSLATVRYVELLRAELTAPNAMAAYKASQCEVSRLLRVFTQRHGGAYALGVLKGARERAYRNVSELDLRRSDDRLPQILPAYSDQDCSELARAGVLGDTVFPPPGKWKP